MEHFYNISVVSLQLFILSTYHLHGYSTILKDTKTSTAFDRLLEDPSTGSDVRPVRNTVITDWVEPVKQENRLLSRPETPSCRLSVINPIVRLAFA